METKEIIDFENEYYITPEGKIFHAFTENEKITYPVTFLGVTKPKVDLYKNGILETSMFVDELMYIHFISLDHTFNKSSGLKLNHIDGDNFNNDISNILPEFNKHYTLSTAKLSKEHSVLSDIIYRCHNQKSWKYKDFGAIGIFVCDRWRDPENGYDDFIIDMGFKPDDRHYLDRKDKTLGFTPENCIWSTYERRNKIEFENRKRKTLVTPGEVISYLTVIREIPPIKYQPRMAECLCMCGNIISIPIDNLRYKGKGIKSCGCHKKCNQ